jgi:hypothetical protein
MFVVLRNMPCAIAQACSGLDFLGFAGRFPVKGWAEKILYPAGFTQECLFMLCLI